MAVSIQTGPCSCFLYPRSFGRWWGNQPICTQKMLNRINSFIQDELLLLFDHFEKKNFYFFVNWYKNVRLRFWTIWKRAKRKLGMYCIYCCSFNFLSIWFDLLIRANRKYIFGGFATKIKRLFQPCSLWRQKLRYLYLVALHKCEMTYF